MTAYTSKTSWLLPHILLVLWLTFLGITIWQHVHRASLPPIYDAMEYFQKAKNVWAIFTGPKLHNPFNVDPAFRPPGTVLMSYPFGFSMNFHGFYFRSILLPLLCIVGSVYVIGYYKPATRSPQWNLAMLSIFLTSFPSFYYFEMTVGGQSGRISVLVDNSLAR